MLNKLSYSVTFPTTGRTLTGEFELKPGFVAPDQKWTEMAYLFGQKRRKVGSAAAAGRSMLSRHAGGGQHGAWHMVLAACGADRKTAADGMRAIFDESGGAVGWRATGSAFWPEQLDLAIAGSRGGALPLIRVYPFDTEEKGTDYSLVASSRGAKP